MIVKDVTGLKMWTTKIPRHKVSRSPSAI